jgi:hypothetical protein
MGSRLIPNPARLGNMEAYCLFHHSLFAVKLFLDRRKARESVHQQRRLSYGMKAALIQCLGAGFQIRELITRGET